MCVCVCVCVCENIGLYMLQVCMHIGHIELYNLGP